MPDYLVEWLMRITADGPVDAARQALGIVSDPQGSATVFFVTDEDGVRRRVDLEEAGRDDDGA